LNFDFISKEGTVKYLHVLKLLLSLFRDTGWFSCCVYYERLSLRRLRIFTVVCVAELVV